MPLTDIRYRQVPIQVQVHLHLHLQYRCRCRYRSSKAAKIYSYRMILLDTPPIIAQHTQHRTHSYVSCPTQTVLGHHVRHPLVYITYQGVTSAASEMGKVLAWRPRRIWKRMGAWIGSFADLRNVYDTYA